ncbi:hypothetical protein GGI21_006317 [Coemansia aciculifera]|nr:hypothetical protein GGI21_006317 [Coemansia aciculifera]
MSDSFLDERNQVSIVATLCGDKVCPTSSSHRPRSSRTQSHTQSPTWSPSGDSHDPRSPTPPPSPLFDPLGPVFGQQAGSTPSPLPYSNSVSNSGRDTASDNDSSANGGGKMKTVASAAASVVAFLVIVALVYRCIRKRRKNKGREAGGSLQLHSEISVASVDGVSSLPATPLSMSMSGTGSAGGVHLARSYSSHSSMSLTQSRLTSLTPVEMSQVRYADGHSITSSGPDDGRPLAAVTRRRPPPPPPPLPQQLPLRPAPPHLLARGRADTYSEIPLDELPPYVDPIEEAMSAHNEAEAEASTEPTPSSQQPGPPPYHVVDISAPTAPH